MSQVRARGEDVRKYIIDNVEKLPKDISRKAAEKFGITRQAVNKHLRRLTAEKFLIEEGETKSRTYKLAPLLEWDRLYTIKGISEDAVWRTDIAPTLAKLPDNVRNIWHHAFTEMFNNALDHSEGTTIYVRITQTAATTEMCINDNGVGIFRKIQEAMGLMDERHAILELGKGKFTTDPKNHSGEGIFFTSRMMDEYDILSGGVYYSHAWGQDHDYIAERERDGRRFSDTGTSVFMKLHNHTARTTIKVFDKFSSVEGGFHKTVVPVALALYGDDQLVSRSQAKRLLARLELFKIVIFDFEKVKTIGQGFTDEIFRVFAQRHPEIYLDSINANSEVKRMIDRAKTGLATESVSPTPDLFSGEEKKPT
jgi:DNA-binding transcriptional ArsR family regulator